MKHTLEISSLGGLSVRRGGEPVTAFKSDKVRALLVYLAVESHRPHRREALAGMFWPGFTEHSARRKLRDALTDLRQVIGGRELMPPILHSSLAAIQFDNESDVWADVKTCTDLVDAEVLQ